MIQRARRTARKALCIGIRQVHWNGGGGGGVDSISFDDDLFQALKQPLVERYLALAERKSKAHMPLGSITASRGIRIVYEKNADRTHPGRNAREPLAS